MRNASLEDCQLLAESEILQRDLFMAAKDQKDHPKKREDCVQHEAGSVSASSLKINRLRDRCDLARHRFANVLRDGRRVLHEVLDRYAAEIDARTAARTLPKIDGEGREPLPRQVRQPFVPD